MQRESFHQNLLRAAGRSLDSARQVVSNNLPETCRFVVRLDSFGDDAVAAGEMMVSDDAMSEGKSVGPLAADEAIELMWRDGMIPEWVDVSVLRIEGDHTIVQLRCSARFTDRDDQCAYVSVDQAPFAHKAPVAPKGWSMYEGPFDLHWRFGH